MSVPTRISRTGLGYLLEAITQPPLPLDDETIAAYLAGILLPDEIAEVEKVIGASPALQEHIAGLRWEHDEWASNRDLSKIASATLWAIYEGTVNIDAHRPVQASNTPLTRLSPLKVYPEASAATKPDPELKLATRDSSQEFRKTKGRRVTWRPPHWLTAAAVLILVIGAGIFFATRSRYQDANLPILSSDRYSKGDSLAIEPEHDINLPILYSGHGNEGTKVTVEKDAVDTEALKLLFSRAVRTIAEGPFSIMATNDAVIRREFKERSLLTIHQSGNTFEHPYAAVPVRFQHNSEELLNEVSQANLVQLAIVINEAGAQGAKFSIEVHAGSGEDPLRRKRLAQERADHLRVLLKEYEVNSKTIERAEGFDMLAPDAEEGIANTFHITHRNETIVLIIKER